MRIAKGQFEKGQEVVEGSGDTNWICCGFPEPLRWWDFLTAVPPPPGGSLRLALWDSRLSCGRGSYAYCGEGSANGTASKIDQDANCRSSRQFSGTGSELWLIGALVCRPRV